MRFVGWTLSKTGKLDPAERCIAGPSTPRAPRQEGGYGSHSPRVASLARSFSLRAGALRRRNRIVIGASVGLAAAGASAACCIREHPRIKSQRRIRDARLV